MKPSFYNYYIPYNSGMVFMNGITESSFWVPESRADAYRTIIEDPDSYYAQFETFINKLINQGFILSDDADEAARVREKYERLCNLRCWYCVQKHQNVWLSQDQMDSVKKMIERKISNLGISMFRLSWFGGEPLMAYEQLKAFTQDAQAMAGSMGKQFSCGITTNGTLLNPTRIEDLKRAGVTHYQITIDGDKNTHDKVKYMANSSAFDITMQNIAILAEHTTCILRFNYSPENLNPKSIISDIEQRLPESARSNIMFNLQPVWQSKMSDEDFNKVIELMDLSKDIGLVPFLKSYGLCYVDKNHYDCVYPSGHVGKCENGIEGIKNALLLDDGLIDTSEVEDLHYKSIFETQNTDCLACKYLPICWGPCNRDRYSQLKRCGCISCVYDNKDDGIREPIRNIFLSGKYMV